MKSNKILINDFINLDQTWFKKNNRDNCSEPFLLLREALYKKGYIVEQANGQNIEDVERILFLNATKILFWKGIKGLLRKLGIRRNGERNWIKEAIAQGYNDRLILILWEGPTNCPENFNESLYKHFTTILTWNDSLADGIHKHKFNLPIPMNVPTIEPVGFSKKKLLLNISYNKTSNYPYELYSERIKTIRYFEKERFHDFDLYGFGWDSAAEGHYPSYKGSVPNKCEVLPYYKFAVCYENTSDQLGWITEKIFDCLRADCVPIYWGAPNIADYVDPGCFIDRRKFSSNKDLSDFICGITEKEYQKYQQCTKEYIASEGFKKFLSQAFVEKVIQLLDLQN